MVMFFMMLLFRAKSILVSVGSNRVCDSHRCLRSPTRCAMKGVYHTCTERKRPKFSSSAVKNVSTISLVFSIPVICCRGNKPTSTPCTRAAYAGNVFRNDHAMYNLVHPRCLPPYVQS